MDVLWVTEATPCRAKNDTHGHHLSRPGEIVDIRSDEDQDPPVTPQAPLREVPGAASPLTRAVLTGPSREGLVLATLPTALYLSAGSVGAHHEVIPVVASDALMLPTATRLSAPGRDLSWAVEPGDTVTIGRSVIRLPGWRVRLVRGEPGGDNGDVVRRAGFECSLYKGGAQAIEILIIGGHLCDLGGCHLVG